MSKKKNWPMGESNPPTFTLSISQRDALTTKLTGLHNYSYTNVLNVHVNK